jgi:hypothetical protein
MRCGLSGLCRAHEVRTAEGATIRRVIVGTLGFRLDRPPRRLFVWIETGAAARMNCQLVGCSNTPETATATTPAPSSGRRGCPSSQVSGSDFVRSTLDTVSHCRDRPNKNSALTVPVLSGGVII